MDLQFSEMSVDTSLAQEYLNKNADLLELCNDYDGKIKNNDRYIYDGEKFTKNGLGSLSFGSSLSIWSLQNMVTSLKENATLIAQLEYLFRNIPIEVTNAQVKLLIQYMTMNYEYDMEPFVASGKRCHNFHPDDSLLVIGSQMQSICKYKAFSCQSKATAAVSHLLLTLLHRATRGAERWYLTYRPTRDYPIDDWLMRENKSPVRGLDSGTVAVVSGDADVDSAVDKFISVSIKAPWRLRRILVQESVYQQFKDALNWKCNLKTSGNEPLASNVLCSDTLTYNDRTFLIDPVELTEESPSVVTVEAYRTTKEVISLVQQDKTRYLSLWTNGIAEINEVTQGTKAPVVWVNNVADFRGPAQVSEAVFSYTYSLTYFSVKKTDGFAKVCELSQSWQKLDLESRRDILCGVLDKYILLDPTNKQYTATRYSLLTCSLKSFVDVGNDYVCIGMTQPVGILGYARDTVFSAESFKSILQGNALHVLPKILRVPLKFSSPEIFSSPPDYTLLEQAGVPVVLGAGVLPNILGKKIEFDEAEVYPWMSGLDTVTRVIWTNSGTIFAN